MADMVFGNTCSLEEVEEHIAQLKKLRHELSQLGKAMTDKDFKEYVTLTPCFPGMLRIVHTLTPPTKLVPFLSNLLPPNTAPTPGVRLGTIAAIVSRLATGLGEGKRVSPAQLWKAGFHSLNIKCKWGICTSLCTCGFDWLDEPCGIEVQCIEEVEDEDALTTHVTIENCLDEIKESLAYITIAQPTLTQPTSGAPLDSGATDHFFHHQEAYGNP
ncbi:hypothetical protein F5051DRAFT_447100 [Lentinula edodes]|nr:hypothetical protein F5051DRAFT_447100 [Lentinula edodes]